MANASDLKPGFEKLASDLKLASEKLAATMRSSLGLDELKAAAGKFATIDVSPPSPVTPLHRLETEILRRAESLRQMVNSPPAGRPKGPSPETAFLVGALKRRLAVAPAGTEPTPIAVEIFEALGFTGKQKLKNMADGLVRAYKRDQVQRFK